METLAGMTDDVAPKKAPKTGRLVFIENAKIWEARVAVMESGAYSLVINGNPAGEFTTSAGAVKYARDAARRRFGNSASTEDTLVRLSKSREGVLVPLCWNAIPDGDERGGGRGHEECATCPYRSTCAADEVVDAEIVVTPKQVEPEENLIARLQAKLGGKQ